MSKSTFMQTFAKKEAMIKALQANYGRISKAADTAQITRQTHYNWYKEDEEYRRRVDNIKYEAFDAFGDLVFDVVIKKLNEGNTAVVNRCFQTMFGRWPEHMEMTNPYKAVIVAKYNYVDKPEDERL